MEITILQTNPGLLEKLALDCSRYLREKRAQRWAVLLRNRNGLGKLSVFEFLDAERQATGVNIRSLQGWPELQLAIASNSHQKFYGLYWDLRRRAWEITGTCDDVIGWLQSSRVDCWLVIEGTMTALIAAHERQYALLAV